MDVNLRNIKRGNVAKVSAVEIKVLKKISDDYCIVDDETDQMLLRVRTELERGILLQTYQAGVRG